MNLDVNNIDTTDIGQYELIANPFIPYVLEYEAAPVLSNEFAKHVTELIQHGSAFIDAMQSAFRIPSNTLQQCHELKGAILLMFKLMVRLNVRAYTHYNPQLKLPTAQEQFIDLLKTEEFCKKEYSQYLT